jgi:hypothetical protein
MTLTRTNKHVFVVMKRLTPENMTEKIRKVAPQNGFKAMGITTPNKLKDLPY